jgi:hypothetical protein
MERTFFIDVSETYTARIKVQANSPEEAELIADELVGGGKVNVAKLALEGGTGANYSKTCEVCKI